MVVGESDTVTLQRGRSADAESGERAQLIVAVSCDRPTEPSSRHVIDGLDHVELGRGKARDASRTNSGGRRRLDLRVADSSMSENHARLTKLRGRWLIEDRDSKNGCLVNGRPTTRSHLADGDVIELGGTFLIFRDEAAPIDGDDDLAADRLKPSLPDLVTFSGELAVQLAAAATIATSTVPVLVIGATGTGKELVARGIHACSRRRGSFIAINCGALPPTLIEAELFGHKRGAFSGALEDRPGHVRAADGGTLLLDEIGELPVSAQVMLLRVLQEREVMPVGESLAVRVDTRVLAATHVDLEARVAEGRFRRDLLARLEGLVVELPPVAERREDLGILLASVLATAAARGRKLTPLAARALLLHDWPDNVRELSMVLTTAVALAGDSAIDLAHLPRSMRERAASEPGPATDAEPVALSAADTALRDRLAALLLEHAGNISAVARAMGKARWQVHRWLRRFHLETEPPRR
jgi:transcriptional regulator with PAS, ATPase and Fis domain